MNNYMQGMHMIFNGTNVNGKQIREREHYGRSKKNQTGV